MNIRDRIIEFKRVNRGDVLPNRLNFRRHPEAQKKALRAVLQEVGIAGAALAYYSAANDGKLTFIDGHLRDEEIPEGLPVLVTDLNDAEASLLLASYDPLSAMAETDKVQLDALLREVSTGNAELVQFLAATAKEAGLSYGAPPPAAPEAQVDRAAELQKKWKVKTGDLWEVGAHRIACDDYRTHDWPAQFVVSDPPYGIDVDTRWLSALNVQRGKPRNMSDDRLANDDGSLDLSRLFAAPKWAVWGFPYLKDESATGWMVWDKWPGTDGTGLGSPVELASSNIWTGLRLTRFMWAGYYRAEGEKRQPHPTQKPVGVMRPLIAFDKSDDVVTDPFLGSGSTLAACEELKRTCYGVELKPEYVAVTLERCTALGLTPKLVVTPKKPTRAKQQPRTKATRLKRK